MSKIFEKNLLGEVLKTYWKPFAASVTAFADKYQYDPFLRTQINVVGILVAFSIFLLTLVAILIDYVYQDVSLAIVTSVRDTILNASTSASVLPSLETIRFENMVTIVLITAVTTIVFSYLLTHVALAPSRNALASQKNFIGNVAHELRTPLTIIKTNTEVALLGQQLSEDTRTMMHSTIEELDRLSAIINNLLSLSTSVRPERIEFATIDAAVVVGDAVGTLENLARARELEVTLRRMDQCYISGNIAALEQIVVNILKNAITYTSRGGRIGVTVERVGDSRVEITVQDSGTGIARRDLFHIFEPFYRAEQSRNRSYGGSGLGLAIVSELVKLHHGKITVRSALGRGTTVVVSFPLVAPQPDSSIRARTLLDEVAVDYSRRRR